MSGNWSCLTVAFAMSSCFLFVTTVPIFGWFPTFGSNNKAPNQFKFHELRSLPVVNVCNWVNRKCVAA